MNRFLLTFLALMTFGVGPLDAQDYFARYGDEPLAMLNISGGNRRPVFVVELNGDQLVIRYNRNSSQEVFIPVTSEGIKLNVVADEQLSAAVSALQGGKYEEAIEGMRPDVYNMIRFLEIPEDKTNLHRYVDRFLFALTQTGEHAEEGFAILDRLDLAKVPQSFLEHAVAFVEQLAGDGKRDEALALIAQLPEGPQMRGVVPTLLDVAANLRDAQSHEQAMALYERVMRLSEGETRTIAQLWNAYCNAVLGRLQTADAYLGTVGEFETTDVPFSLRMLVEGQLALATDDIESAIRSFSRGLVFADVSFSWMAELTYWSGFCYEQLNRPDTARFIYEELKLLFPNSSWAGKARDRLLDLPPPAEPEA